VERSCLLIIDVQAGFVNEATRAIPAAVERLQADFERVYATRFSNPEGSFFRSLIGWPRFAPGSRDVEFAFTPREDAVILEKTVYTCVTPAFLKSLRANDVAKVHLCGIATDSCVLKCAVDLFEAGVEPVVLADFCGSHGGAECHEAGLLLLRRFIGSRQVI
jgi:nicotinamidase-related amidase